MRALPVDLEELSIAFEAFGADLHWYLDTETGAVILLNREYDPADHQGLTPVEIETNTLRFVPVPKSDSVTVAKDMFNFAISVADSQLKESLELALSTPRPDKYFKKALSWLPEQQARWHAFHLEACRQRVLSWLRQQGITPTSQAA
jgi:Uncharacterised protein family (UPF0158)